MQLLKLRFFQVKRDLGYWAIAIAGTAFYIASVISEMPAKQASLLVIFITLTINNHRVNRKDLNFIRKQLDHPRIQIGSEYNLLVLPVTLAYALSDNWPLAILLHLLIFAIVFVNFKTLSIKLLAVTRIIPASQFEWVSGIRRSFFILLALVVPLLLLSPVKLFGLAALFLVDLVILGYYNFFEPLIMLNPDFLSPEDFLGKKIAFLRKSLVVVNVPVLFMNSIFNPDVMWFNIGYLFALLLLASCTVFIKYASYRPNDSMRMSVDMLVLTGSLFFPYLIPLGIIIYFSTKRKAINNLSHYCNDSN